MSALSGLALVLLGYWLLLLPLPLRRRPLLQLPPWARPASKLARWASLLLLLLPPLQWLQRLSQRSTWTVFSLLSGFALRADR